MSYVPETHLQYAQRVGPPRSVACVIDLGSGRHGSPVWVCKSHDYGFNQREDALDSWPPTAPWRTGWPRFLERCPMSRLEEWRARRWAA